ncbi:MAG: sporulation-delaying protein SdpB family protein [Taibaiella sp.]|jgi:antimicrobial peptide system SdpB family protein
MSIGSKNIVLKSFSFKINNSIDGIIKRYSTRNYYNNGLAISRSLLALCTLLTLVTNNPKLLFNQSIGQNSARLDLLPFLSSKINLFKLFHENLPYLGTVVAVIILIVVIGGWRPRITGILHFWVAYSFIGASALFDGGDQICSNLCLFLIPITLIDNRPNHWKRSPIKLSPYLLIVSNLFFLIVRLQMAFIYFNSATSKFAVPEWSNGTAVYYWLVDPYFGMNAWQSFILSPFITSPIFIFIISWGVLAIELLLFIGLFVEKKYFNLLLKIGISLHLSFLFCLGLFSFFFAMAGGLFLYLYVPFLNYRNNYHEGE